MNGNFGCEWNKWLCISSERSRNFPRWLWTCMASSGDVDVNPCATEHIHYTKIPNLLRMISVSTTITLPCYGINLKKLARVQNMSGICWWVTKGIFLRSDVLSIGLFPWDLWEINNAIDEFHFIPLLMYSVLCILGGSPPQIMLHIYPYFMVAMAFFRIFVIFGHYLTPENLQNTKYTFLKTSGVLTCNPNAPIIFA